PRHPVACVRFAQRSRLTATIQRSTAMADDTIFHAIMRREIPADIVHEDEHVIAFRDIAPQAPVHVLFVPKETIPTLDALKPSQADVVGRLVLAAAAYARAEGFAEDGYRMVMNCNG